MLGLFLNGLKIIKKKIAKHLPFYIKIVKVVICVRLIIFEGYEMQWCFNAYYETNYTFHYFAK